MSWLNLIILGMRLLLALSEWAKRRQLIAAVEAVILKEALADADKRLAEVRAARDAARARGVPDDSDIFRD